MESNWFANRGQALQTVLTFLGVFIAGVNAWPAISSFQFLSVAPILFYVLIGLFILVLTRKAQRSRGLIAVSQPIATPDPLVSAPAKAQGLKPASSDYLVDREFQPFKLGMGEVWRSADRRVVLHDLARNTEKPRSALYPESDYVADVEVSFGGRLIYAGPSVRDGMNYHFLVPVCPSGHNAEPGSLYAFSYSPAHVNFEFFTITHINFHKKEIDAVFGVVNWRVRR
jgi:hypothetical protein